MKWADRVAGHVGDETVVSAALFQRRGTAAHIGDEGGMPSGAPPELEAPGFPSNTTFALTDAGMLYAFHKNPKDGRRGLSGDLPGDRGRRRRADAQSVQAPVSGSRLHRLGSR
jgi:hypothetical protein